MRLNLEKFTNRLFMIYIAFKDWFPVLKRQALEKKFGFRVFKRLALEKILRSCLKEISS